MQQLHGSFLLKFLISMFKMNVITVRRPTLCCSSWTTL